MSKTTLGRGLGDLLGSNRATVDPPRNTVPARAVDGGLRILIDGTPREPEPAPPLAPSPALPAVSTRTTALSKAPTDCHQLTRVLAVAVLVGADFALLGWTSFHVITHQQTLGFEGVAVCAVSTLMAAACGVVAARIIVSGE